MPYLNAEIKAKCKDPDLIRQYLHQYAARFIGTDNQSDTYFNVNKGRLKLREGNIENNLIYYEREDVAGLKSSHFQLLKINDPGPLKSILENSFGVKIVFRKRREIYYINNVKFHIDDVPGLGSFVEIEAGNVLEDKTEDELKRQCEYYINELGINSEDLISGSYSDMMLEKQKIT